MRLALAFLFLVTSTGYGAKQLLPESLSRYEEQVKPGVQVRTQPGYDPWIVHSVDEDGRVHFVPRVNYGRIVYPGNEYFRHIPVTKKTVAAWLRDIPQE
jgi:hypothetical protein